MILDFTDEELKAFKALEDGYEKLLKESEGKIKKLRKKDPEPDMNAYRKLQESRPLPPPMPEPLEVKDGTPVYSKSDIDAYHNSKEYKAFAKEQNRINAAVDKLFTDWYDAGSEAWKQESEHYKKLQDEYAQAQADFLQKVEDRQFNALGNDPREILKDAFKQSERLINDRYYYYEKLRNGGDFSARDVRLQDDGNFKLDTRETKRNILGALKRHLSALPEEEEKELTAYIDKALATNPFTSNTGKLGATVSRYETTEEKKSILAVRPTDYVTTVDRVTKKLFSNDLIRPIDSDPDALYEVRLDSEKSNKVFARAALDYNDLLSKGNIKDMPTLTEKDYNVHDAIITLMLAGNRVMSYDMIYRAMTGKVTGKVTVTDEAKNSIDEALNKFEGRFILEYEYKDENGKTLIRSYDEPLVTFQRLKDREKINGKVINGGIRIPDDKSFTPPLLKWAQFNNNEIDTRDITLLDVPRLNNGDESFIIKMCLYRRIIKMRNDFERLKKGKYELKENLRTIRYDYIYEALNIDPDTLTKDKKHDLKVKIDKCLAHWTKKHFIEWCETKKDKSGANYAIVVHFLPME